jgi:hypothetical protein
MNYTDVAILSIALLSLGFISSTFPIVQPGSAAGGSLLFHFTNIPLLGQNVIIKVTGNSGTLQWREHLYPLLSDTVVERVSGLQNGELLTACLTAIYGSSKKVTSCDDAQFNPTGTDFFLCVPGKCHQFNK